VGESQDIQQIEYRWQPKTDMTAVATSMSEASRRSWTQRIGPWIRHPGVEAPTESVRYEIFGNGNAAIAWRQRDPQAAMVTEGQATRPLVSRVLVGSAEMLTPELAMAVCAMGLPAPIGPPPGTVAVGTELPPISGAALTGMVDAMIDKLDAAAARETGLEPVIAAALSDRDMPLSVELPERLICLPVRSGPQSRLLWGLRRTLWPLLGRSPGRRDWSFSTFEPPLSDMDPGALGAIVFRLTQAAQHGAPMTFRPEVRVRPYEPVARPAETFEQELASLLVAAYVEHGGRKLGQLLTEWTRDCATADRRIDVAHNMLARNAVAVVGPGTKFVPVTPQAQQAQQNPARPAREEAGFDVQDRQPQPIPGQAGGYTEDAKTVLQPTSRLPTPTPPIPPPVPVARSVEVQRQAEHDADFQRRPAKLSHLLLLLSNEPASSGFDSALWELTAGMFETEPADRAVARKLLRDYGWYVGTLERNAQVRFDDILVMIFMRAVLPDLSQPEVARELTDWAGRSAAPPRVIKALYAACVGMDERQELDRILGPVLGGRWLSENGISAPPTPRVQPVTATQDRDAVRAARESAPRAPAPAAAGSPAADPAPLLSLKTVVTFLKRRIPVYVALLVVVGLVIVVQFVV
jgi:hypothetical protein